MDAASNGELVVAAGRCGEEWTGPFCLARFSAAGDFLGVTVLPLERINIARVASNGDGFVVLLGMNPPREVLALHVAADGSAGDPVLLHTWGAAQEAMSVTSAGGKYFVTYGFGADRRVARLSETGAEKETLLGLPSENLANIAAGGSGDLLLVTATSNSPRFAIYDTDLNLVSGWSPFDAGPTPVSIAPVASGWSVLGSMNLLNLTVTAQPIFRDGRHGPARIIGTRAWASIPDATGRDDRAAFVWATAAPVIPDPSNDVKLAIAREDGTPILDATTISLGPAPQLDPVAAHGDGVTLAAWRERTAEGTFAVEVRRFDSNGRALGAAARVPFRGATHLRPDVAFGDGAFFVVWPEGPGGTEGIYGVRVSPAGVLLDAEPLALFDAATAEAGRDRRVSVAWNGDAWIVASSDERHRIVARRVGRDGSLVGAPLALTPPREDDWRGDRDPVVECNGAECLVAWQGPPLPNDECRITCPPPPPTVLAMRISPSLVLLDGEPRLLTAQWEQPLDVDVSWNGIADAWLVSWSNVGEQRIARDGALLPRGEPEFILDGPRSILAEREGWRMVWGTNSGRDLFHKWSATGSVFGPDDRFVLTRTPDRESAPRLVAAPRPLALFVREGPINAGAPIAVGAFLDEATAPDTPAITLTAERIEGRQLRLTWEVEGALVDLSIEEHAGYWRTRSYTPYTTRSIVIIQDGARRFRVSGTTSAGFRIYSNEVEAPGIRHRVMDR